jgi:DNA-directed RNA polymerase specialized sigma24 family protein
MDTEAFFQREFVRELFAAAVGQLRAELDARGRGVVFAVFERYDLGPEDGAGYAEIARELDLPVTQVTNHLHAARRRFREIVLGRLRELSGSEPEFRDEAREILGLELA